MKVDELPVEILMHIFSYLLTFKRISLVNRRFYEVACKANDKNVSLTLDAKFFKTAENRSLLQSIEGSNRKIKKVEISLWKFTEENKRSIVSVLTKFSATIKHLKLYGSSTNLLELPYFLEMLALVPNTEHLDIKYIRVFHSEKHQLETSNNEDLNLKHLKILELNLCGEMYEVVFNRLPEGVLREFYWNSGYDLLSLETLFSRQKNIKKLSLVQWNSGFQLPAHFLDNLELELLEMRNIDIETTALSRQTKLKSLKTDKDQVVVKVVANNLTDLEELEWKVADVTPVNDFVNISRLGKLKRLKLIGVGKGILNELIKLDNSRITTLEIEDFDDITVHQIQLLAKSAPNLKVLKLTDNLDWDRITEVLNNFNFVESLTLGNVYNVGSYEKYLNQNDSVNAKLTELTFSMGYETMVLRKMIAKFPYLKKLTILSRTNITSSNFQLILNGFTKLESLDLGRFVLLTFDDFKYLRDHRNRLQFVRLRDRNGAFEKEHLEDLEAMFEVVKCPSSFNLLLKM